MYDTRGSDIVRGTGSIARWFINLLEDNVQVYLFIHVYVWDTGAKLLRHYIYLSMKSRLTVFSSLINL